MAIIEPNESMPLARCKKCGLLKPRKQDSVKPFFGDGKTRRLLDGDGKLWNGYRCPSCTVIKAKQTMQKLRNKKRKDKKGNKDVPV